MLIPMAILGLGIDSSTKNPIVILKEIDGERMLPIWIGILEANAIATELEGVKLLRPMTHDLVKTILDTVDVKVNKVEVCDLKDNTYYALIHITHHGKEISIDARPSDSLALSLRANAPVFVAEEVINRSAHVDIKLEPEDTSEEGMKWLKILEKMEPDDFGNT